MTNDRKALETWTACPGEGRVERVSVLGTYFSLVSYRDVMAAILGWRARRERHYVTLTPPFSVMLCRHDRYLQQATNDAALVLPDGVGIILAARLLGYPHHGRVTGPTLMLRLCDEGRAWGARHFFYGGWPDYSDALIARLTARFPGMIVAGAYCPPFRELSEQENAALVRRVNDCHPDIVWIGTGSGKQEKWMARHVGGIHAAALIGVGAAFDFHSGRVPWAPKWMRQMGIEWMYRLAREPRRLWRRNTSSFVFLAQVLHQAIRRADRGRTVVTYRTGSSCRPGSPVNAVPDEQAAGFDR